MVKIHFGICNSIQKYKFCQSKRIMWKVFIISVNLRVKYQMLIQSLVSKVVVTKQLRAPSGLAAASFFRKKLHSDCSVTAVTAW